LPSFAFFKIRRTWSFHVVVLKRTAKKCTRIYNARAQPLFYLLSFLFGGVLFVVGVVVCSSSLITAVMEAMETCRNTFVSIFFVYSASVPQHQLRYQEFYIICVLDGESALY